MYLKIQYYGSILDAKYAPYVDKLEAKRIVKEICGEDIEVAPIIKILNKIPDDLCDTDLNTDWLIKSAHGSRWNIDPIAFAETVRDTATKQNIQITKELVLRVAKKQLHAWNKTYALGIENQYKSIVPRFFIEQKITDHEHGITGRANTYSVRCIHGDPISFHTNRNDTYNAWLLPTWKLIIKDLGENVLPPNQAKRIITLAKKLAKPFEFVRVDFYIDNQDKLYFSEYTFTPNAGKQFYTDAIERKLGALWT